MSKVEPAEQDDKPLDPVMENVRRKMVKLQMVSAGIMLVMFMAVLAAVVYKVTRPDATPKPVAGSGFAVPSAQPLAATAALPAGFEVQSVSLSGNQILFYGRLADGQRKAIVFDATVGRVVADIAVTGN